MNKKHIGEFIWVYEWFAIALCYSINTLKNRMLGILMSNSKKRTAKALVPKPDYALETLTQTLSTQMPLSRTVACICANRRPICVENKKSIIYCTSVSLASITLLPAIPFTFSSKPPPASKASISSPPPILLPLTSTFGTVRRPVLFASAACRPGPKG